MGNAERNASFDDEHERADALLQDCFPEQHVDRALCQYSSDGSASDVNVNDGYVRGHECTHVLSVVL